jgi:HK97 gp10 family phage protein
MSTIQFDQDLKDLLKKLDDLPVMIEKKLVRGALRAAAKPMRDTAAQLAPTGTARVSYNKDGTPVQHSGGALKKSIRISSSFSKRTGEVKILVKAGDKKAWYAYLVEHGAKPHLIKGPIKFGGVIISNFQHPGFTGKAFMRPAFDSTTQAVVGAYADYMRLNLPKELEKYRGQR